MKVLAHSLHTNNLGNLCLDCDKSSKYNSILTRDQ